jgi:hypothetical protein
MKKICHHKICQFTKGLSTRMAEMISFVIPFCESLIFYYQSITVQVFLAQISVQIESNGIENLRSHSIR